MNPNRLRQLVHLLQTINNSSEPSLEIEVRGLDHESTQASMRTYQGKTDTLNDLLGMLVSSWVGGEPFGQA